MTAPLSLSLQAQRTADSPISYFIQKAISTPGLVSLAAGLVDESCFPAGEIAATVNAMMADPAASRAALQYGSTQGHPKLRGQVLGMVLEADKTPPTAVGGLSKDDVILTTGSQQLLYLLGEALFDVGDIVICEAPSYFVYHGVLQSHGVRVLSVPMDDGGMRMDELERLLLRLEAAGELPRVKLIYTVDYFQNPTGLTLAAERRPQLVELAKRFSKQHRILILEDAAYRELRYEGDDIPSVKSFDPANEYVIYTSTFSKPCAPGLKTGYALLPRELVAPMCHLKGNHDFGSSNLAQHILSRLIESGAYARHVQALRGVYRTKSQAMLRSLEREFADWKEVTWTHPRGGLYVWLRFPAGFDAGDKGPLVNRALAEGVLYVPGEFGHVPDDAGHLPKNEVRLSFGVSTPEQIAEGIRRLRKACRGLERSERAI
jgi:2-aminoadipate transaminase